MNYRAMFDTNIVSDVLRFPHGKAATRLRAAGAEAFCLSAIVAGELRFGSAKLGSPRLTAQVEGILQLIATMPFEGVASRAYALVRTHLERSGRIIGPNDLFIAAHALALDLPLITANIGEFSRVPNLRVENWLD
ncbi:MAG TPA: type II toxin-antitoxin system VapC family toxin [Devosia sp.]|nr:type II toxin-antitoxin system VapC family toxin [Devosia sp.]